jgi:hypothetical protein
MPWASKVKVLVPTQRQVPAGIGVSTTGGVFASAPSGAMAWENVTLKVRTPTECSLRR